MSSQPSAADVLATRVTDLVVTIDADGNLLDVNDWGLEFLGYQRDEVLGRPFADFVHPDEIEGAFSVMARVADPALAGSVQAAHYRLCHKNGTYVDLWVNGVFAPGADEGRDVFMVSGRRTADVEVFDRLMELLTAGAPSEEAFALVPSLGDWRQPEAEHAVFYQTDEGKPAVAGSALLGRLGGPQDPNSPLAHVAAEPHGFLGAVDELPVDLSDRARELGLVHLEGRSVLDPLNDGPCVALVGQREQGDAPAGTYVLQRMVRSLDLIVTWRDQVVRLRRAAHIDPLTGLVNRRGLNSSLLSDPSLSEASTIGVLYIDLDRFKPVNDVYGHETGDVVLELVADRLRQIVRPGDVVARLGGDEFAVVVRDADASAPEAVADRIVADLRRPFELPGMELSIGASVGVVVETDQQVELDDLLRRADSALYRAKDNGRDQWQV